VIKRLLVILACIPLCACSLFAEVQEGVYDFKTSELGSEGRDLWERDKRESLEIGNGPLAVWGRRIEATIDVRYLDGTVVYKGHVFDYIGFVGDTSIHDAANQRSERGMLAQLQHGIVAGINGMGIGGRRRITIQNPHWVCVEPRKINTEATCLLTEHCIRVYQRPLVVEAKLTESCIHGSLLFPPLLPEGEPMKLAVAAPILPVDSPTIPSGDCTRPKKEWADRLIAISPFPHTSFSSISPYNIPFVDKTFPANRSSNIVA